MVLSQVCRVECNQVGEVRWTAVVVKMVHQCCDLGDDAILNGQPVQLL